MSSNRESLSALMDSEATEFELRRALKHYDENSEDAQVWRRYHLARTLMREQSIDSTQNIDSTVDISSRVMASISEEQSTQSEETNSSSWSAVGSMAVAASLTLAVMIGLNSTNLGEPSALASNGYLERNQGSSDLMRTSLASGVEASQDSRPTLEVIRLSEGLRGQIDEHIALLNSAATDWQVNWLPDGFAEVSERVVGDSQSKLFKKGSQVLSVVIKPADSVSASEGALSAQGLVAVGRLVDDRFVSVVGDLSLTDADKVAASVVVASN
jgi:hypothetical protein